MGIDNYSEIETPGSQGSTLHPLITLQIIPVGVLNGTSNHVTLGQLNL
jgi:hypothetical protein